MSDQPHAFLGINIGGTECSLVLGTAEGDFLHRAEWQTAEAPAPEQTLEKIGEVTRPWKSKYAWQGIGVAIGGPLDTERGIVLGPPNLPGWGRVLLREVLAEQFQVPVEVAHDAAACALAESRFGGHQREDTLVYLTCGTGFGVGMVQRGKNYEGAEGVHPEIGHWRLTEGGPEAFDREGSAEAYCSGKGFSRIAAWKYPERWSDPEPDPETITQLARGGDGAANEVVSFQAKMTGRVCAMIAEMLCPHKILLGSLARHLGPFWVDQVVRYYHQEVLARIGNTVQVVPASLGARLQELSALAVAMGSVQR